MGDLRIEDVQGGKTVFACRDFRAGETIFEFTGPKLTLEELPTPYETVVDHYFQIGEKLYMGPSGTFDDFINHSCDPNGGLQIGSDHIYLVALRDIRGGEEVAWDYSTTMDEDDWELECRCGSPLCRKVIQDFKLLPKSLRRRYASLRVVPEYNLKYV